MKPFSAQIKKPARKAGLAAMPTRVMQDRREPVRGRRSRAFSQDRRRSQAPRGLIPILMLLTNSGCLIEVA